MTKSLVQEILPRPVTPTTIALSLVDPSPDPSELWGGKFVARSEIALPRPTLP